MITYCLDIGAMEIPSSNENTVRLAFMGKSGSGKSTAVNTIYNLFLQTKWNAYPKLFPIPTHFQACNVDEYKGLFNENHSHQQLDAVTKDPYEYVACGDRFKLSLVDCPGTADPRGLDQDLINGKKNAKYIAKLSFISAFCVVVKGSVNRETKEELYAIEEIKSLLPKNATDRIFIIATHCDLPNENIKNFAESVGLPTENIFFFDNFALTKEGHIKISDHDFKEQSIDLNNPFDPIKEQTNHVTNMSIAKIKDSWLASYGELQRLLKKTTDLKPFQYEMKMFEEKKDARHFFITLGLLISKKDEELLNINKERERLIDINKEIETTGKERVQAKKFEEQAIKEYTDALFNPSCSITTLNNLQEVCILCLHKKDKIYCYLDELKCKSFKTKDLIDKYSQEILDVNSKIDFLKTLKNLSLSNLSGNCLNIHGSNYCDILIRKEQNLSNKTALELQKRVFDTYFSGIE